MLYKFLYLDLFVCAKSYYDKCVGSALAEYLMAPLQLCVLAVGHPKVAQALLFVLSDWLRWAQPASAETTAALQPHLQKGLHAAAVGYQRGDLLNVLGRNAAALIDVHIEHSNMKLACAMKANATYTQGYVAGVAHQLPGRAHVLGCSSEKGSILKELHDRPRSKSAKPDYDAVRRFVSEKFDQAAAGDLDSWQRQDLFDLGREKILAADGILARAVRWWDERASGGPVAAGEGGTAGAAAPE